MKRATCIVLSVLVLLFTSIVPGYTTDRGRHHGGGHHHHGGGSHFSGSIWLGPGWWGGWGPWWGAPYYPYYPYYPSYQYYPAPPAVAPQQAPVYVQPSLQPEEEYYWYFCRKPEGYYPYVKQCPGGWLKVIPPSPPDEEE